MNTRIYIIASVIVLLIAGAVVYLQLVANESPSLSSLLSSSNKNSSDLKPQGAAPEFAGITNWLNSEKPLTLADLRGKVVLVDFWTYSCINCIRTLPYVTRWYDTYRDQGLVMVGVHTPEFDFEKNSENVKMAMERYNIHYPVALDNNYATWRAYDNHYWPAEYLIDQNGQVVYTHFGEGNYDYTENAIRQLLGLNADSGAVSGGSIGKIASPEMYFGLSRQEFFVGPQIPSVNDAEYTFPALLPLNKFALSGQWRFSDEYAQLSGASGEIRLRFSSGKVFMVASAENSALLRITVDGKSQPDVLVQFSQLYTLFDSDDYREHVIDIEILQSGLQAFTFTFG